MRRPKPPKRGWLTLALATGAAAAASLVIAAEGPRGLAGAIDDARMLNADKEPHNWLVHGGDFAGRHYSTLNQINLETVQDLKPAWSIDFDTDRGQESEPIVVDGVAYVTTAASKVYALDAATGRRLWYYDPKVPGRDLAKACCDIVNRGVAVYRGKVYLGAMDGRLIALDARTGKVAWSTQTTPRDGLYTITGYPRVIRGKVIIGNAGGDLGIRGFVAAYDAESGKQVWKFYLVPGDPAVKDNAASDEIMEKLVRPTWFGTNYYKYGGGGNAWNEISYDPELNQLYVGTGNGSPWNIHYRSDGKGDNLFLCAIVALDPDTGKYKWHYQENPGDSWDYNSVMPIIQTDLSVGGQTRKVLMHAPKNGFFYVIDRTNGKLISAGGLVPNISWTSGIDLATGRPKDTPNNRYETGPFTNSPQTGGAHNWEPMALHPDTGLVYLPVQEGSTRFTQETTFTHYGIGAFNTGLIRQQTPGPAYLTAWDPRTQKAAWKAPVGGGGVLATKGGLIFQGNGDATGELAAYRATDGKKVWASHVPNGIQAPPVTYSVNGQQYILVAGGQGGGGPVSGGAVPSARQVGRLFAFKLNGTGKFPPDPAPAPPPNPAPDAFTAAQVAQGADRYGVFCVRCHGPNASSNNIIPDLRRSAFLPSKAGWNTVVMKGVLEPKGMLGWSDYIKDEDAEAIRAFISAKATELKNAPPPRSAGPPQGRTAEQ